jgi:hypothetical protein
MALNRRNAKLGNFLMRNTKPRSTGVPAVVRQHRQSAATPVSEPGTRAPDGEGFRSASSGRFVSRAERVAAARARVTADSKRGVETATWIVDLAKQA